MIRIKQIVALLLCATMLLNVAPIQVGATMGASVSVSSQQVNVNQYLYVPVYGENLEDLASLELELYYDSDLLHFQYYYMSMLPDATTEVNANTPGKISIASISPDGIYGSGELLCLVFYTGNSAGECPMQLFAGDARNSQLEPVEVHSRDGRITVNKPAVRDFYAYCYTDWYEQLQKGDSFTIRLCNSNSYENRLASGTIEFHYDDALFRVENVQLSYELQNNALIDVNTAVTGMVKAAFATDGDGISSYELMNITLTVVGDVSRNAELKFKLYDLYNAELAPYQPYECSSTVRLTQLPQQSKTYRMELLLDELIVGQETAGTVWIQEGAGVGAGNFVLHYDPQVFECVNAEVAHGLSQLGGYADANFDTRGQIKFSFVNPDGNS